MPENNKPDITFLLDEILSNDETRQQNARIMLLALDVEAVQALSDAFYAGVSELHGVVIIDVLTEIGGWEATLFLEDVAKNNTNNVWKRWAVLGLARCNREDVLELVLDWLESGSLEERKTAVLALGYIGGDKVVVALIHALHEPDIAAQAVRALALRKHVQGLAAGYGTDNAHVWELVTDALLDMGDEGVLPLIDIMQNENPDYYDQVMVSLQNSTRPEAKEVLQAGDYDADGSHK